MMNELERILIETVSYAVSFDGKAIFCRMCGNASHNQNDIENRYCGHCHLFHDNRKLEEFLAKQTPKR
jgi:hypothetical protein